MTHDKHDTTMRDGIEAALKALTRMLEYSSRHAADAHGCIRRNEQNLAIGTLILVENALEQAMSLYRAIIAMHRYKP